MKIKNLINELKKLNQNADIKVCYTHEKKNYFQEIEAVEHNQILKSDKIIKNENIVLMWLK